jgi:hypothetical protein
LFRFEAKITKSKRSEEKLKTKKTKTKPKNAKNSEKVKKAKKSEKIDLNFASLCFASKQKLLKWSEAKNLKRKEAKKEKWNFIVK